MIITLAVTYVLAGIMLVKLMTLISHICEALPPEHQSSVTNLIQTNSEPGVKWAFLFLWPVIVIYLMIVD